MSKGRCNVYWSVDLSILSLLIHTPRTKRGRVRRHNVINRTRIYTHGSNDELWISNLVGVSHLLYLQMRVEFNDTLYMPPCYPLILFSSGKYTKTRIEYRFKIENDCVCLSLQVLTVGFDMTIKRNYCDIISLNNPSILKEVSGDRCICWIHSEKRVLEGNRSHLILLSRELYSSITCCQQW